MRIFVGSLQHETNTFVERKTRFDDFDFVRGMDSLDRLAVTRLFEDNGVEIVPSMYANALPSGLLERRSFETFLSILTDSLGSAKRLDGIWLYLHGAMEVEGIGSGETEILRVIRSLVGYSVPIALALDFHANNHPELSKLANIVCGYWTAPHTDMEQTEIRAGKALMKCIESRALPHPVMVDIPMMITGDKVITDSEPARSIMTEVKRIESEDGILAASLFNGQPWVDAPNTGASVIVTPEDTEAWRREKAKVSATRLAQMLWDARADFDFEVEAFPPEVAVDTALNATEPPVFITDSGDNTTAGAAGRDATLLRLLLAKHADKTLVAGITDPETVGLCRELPDGERAEFTIGDGRRAGSYVETEARIIRCGRMLGWYGEDAGWAAILRVEGVDVCVTERPCGFISEEIFSHIGLSVNAYNIVVVKLGYLFPGLRVIARRAIFALTSGASCEDLTQLEFGNVERPVYPLDTDFGWTPSIV